jgi:deoxyribonuclease V
MILAVDVAYKKKTAVVGGVLFSSWTDAVPEKEFITSCRIQGNYVPGQFYKRELPCIAALLKLITEKFDCIIVDGFVYLGRDRKPGLGRHLYDSLGGKVAVIGVAKAPFKDTPKSCEVLRENSRKPLYVTAEGIEVEKAKFLVKNMHGQNRIPTLLNYADRLCRKGLAM